MPNTNGLVVADKNIFSCLPYISLCKTCDHRASHFGPQGHNLNKLGTSLLVDAIHTKYQGSMPCGFRLEDFFMFSQPKPN